VAESEHPYPPIIRFGTSSFSSPDWVGSFYPDGTPPAEFLRFYAARFDTVEVDSTYYAVPAARTVDGWAAKTPESFLIAAKFPRAIVHGGEGARPDASRVLAPEKTYRERDRFLSVMERLGPRTGPLVLQFPYFARSVFSSSGRFFERLDRFLADLPPGFRYGVEIRNRAWLEAEFFALCAAHRAAAVLVDQAWMPHPDELGEIDPITTDFTYIRLLGDRKEIEALTTRWDREVIDRGARIERWARYLAQLSRRGLPVLVYVNNHYAGHAPTTVQRLKKQYESERSG
jgi:uncharacterized protein YecE (DUF72 family)